MPDQTGDSFGSVEDVLAYLSAIETTVENEVEKIADSLDAVTDRISASLRSAIGDSSWLPLSKPAPPPPSPAVHLPPTGYLEASRDWISRNRAITAAVVCFLGTGAFLVWRRRRVNRAKRRAKRAKNGQRTEIVILAGPPSAPLTRSLSLDLERRGFIVYIPVNSLWEERLIQAEAKTDIHPLHLDITSSSSIASTIRKLNSLLDPSSPPKYSLNLASFILLPQTPSPPPSRPIAELSADAWSECLTTHLLSPFTLLQAFLPLIAAHKASILFLGPSNTPALAPPQHALENIVAGGMERYIATLRKEINSTLGDLNLVQFKLGAFNDASDRDAFKMAVALRPEHTTGDVTGPRSTTDPRNTHGTPLRELHLELFDAIVGKRNGTVYVGRGSRTYDYLGKFVPDGLVGWMLGLNSAKADVQKDEKADERVDGGGSPGWEKVDQISEESA
ncbi:MAG: hypothetical protein Q9207_004003 [Kuettlingeria erythrocarpa]